VVTKTTILYIIRHCEAKGNIEEVFQGRTDGDITEKGALQLEKLKERCKDIPFDIIYTSPLLRAEKTAVAVNSVHNAPLKLEPDLMEINGGDMEGEKWLELPSLFPDTYSVWLKDIGHFEAPNGESMRGVYNRMKNAVLRIISQNEGKTIGLVSHGCAIYNLLSFIHGFSEEEITAHPFWCDNTSISRADFINGDFKPVFINDSSHIKDSAETAPHKMLWRVSANR